VQTLQDKITVGSSRESVWLADVLEYLLGMARAMLIVVIDAAHSKAKRRPQ